MSGDETIEIAPMETKARYEGATNRATTVDSLPPRIPNALTETPVRGKRARSGVTAMYVPPASPPTTSLAATVIEIVLNQKIRRHCIKAQSFADRTCESFIASMLGYRTDLPEAQRKAIYAKARTMRRAVEKWGQCSCDNHLEGAPEAGSEDRVLAVCTPIILNSAASREGWDNLRKRTEREMEKQAATLPVEAWRRDVRGLGLLGVAIIVGEAGDIGTYETKERVWKRLGLAVINGERQQKRSDPEQAAIHGYKPKRHAEVWVVGDSLFQKQWAGAKDEDGVSVAKSGKSIAIPAHSIGHYGAVYAARKLNTETRGWTPAHRDNDARRIMLKAVVESLWRVWRGLPPIAHHDEPAEAAQPMETAAP